MDVRDPSKVPGTVPEGPRTLGGVLSVLGSLGPFWDPWGCKGKLLRLVFIASNNIVLRMCFVPDAAWDRGPGPCPDRSRTVEVISRDPPWDRSTKARDRSGTHAAGCQGPCAASRKK